MKQAWHDSDEFWNTFGSSMFTPDRIESATKEVEQVIHLVDKPEPMDILDLCCGPGRHSAVFSRRGNRVTGVDRTQSYLEQARTRDGSEGLSTEYVQGDMRTFTRPASFDLIVNMFGSFCYFEDPVEDKQVLANSFTNLRTEGVFVQEIMSKEILARQFKPRDWQQLPDGSIQLEEREIHDNWSMLRGRWMLVKEGQIKEFHFHHRLYSATELSNLLIDVGFREVKVFGNLEGKPYDHQAQRLVAVAIKQ